MGLLFSSESTRNFIASLSNEKGFMVSYKDVKEPTAVRGELVLPQPTFENEELWHGQTHKELSFLLPDNKFLFDCKEGVKENSMEAHVTSILADYIAERRDYGEYAGRTRHVTNNRVRLSRDLLRQLKDINPEELTPESELIRSLVNFDIRKRKAWMNKGEMDTVQEQEDCKYMGNLEKTFPDGLPMPNNKQEFDQLLQQITSLIQQPPEPDPEDGEGEGEGEGEGGEGGEGKEKSTDSGDNSNDEQQQQQEQEGEGKENASGQGRGDDEQGQQQEASARGQEKGEAAKDDAESGGGKHRGNDDLTGDAGVGSGADGLEDFTGTGKERSRDDDALSELIHSSFKDLKDGQKTGKQLQEDAYDEYWRMSYSGGGYEDYLPVSTTRMITGKELDRRFEEAAGGLNAKYILNEAAKYPISKKLKKYLLVLSTTSYTYGMKKGKMVNSKLYRAATGEREPRVYKQQHSSRLELNTAVSVLTDCSGSMSGRKERVANVTNMCVFDVLRTMQIPLELLGFSDQGALMHMQFKTFNEKLSREVLGQRLCSNARVSGGNSDGDSLLWAAERLMQRPEPNKVLIVLSDGQPAGSYRGDGGRYLCDLAAELENKTPINLWGVGILTSAPARFYKNHYICNQLEDLESIVLNILRRSIVKR